MEQTATAPDYFNIKLKPIQEKAFRGKSCLKHRLAKQKCPPECPGREKGSATATPSPKMAPTTVTSPINPRAMDTSPFNGTNVPFPLPSQQQTQKCPNKGAGCEWEGNRNDVQFHVPKCELQLTPCKWNCNGLFFRRELRSHEEVCPQKGGICDRCGLPFRADHSEKHKIECTMYPVECIKKCGMTIVRSKEAYHLLNDCPLQFIRCINSDRGCSSQLVRKDLSEHLKDCLFEKLKPMLVRMDLLEQKVKLQADKLQEQEVRLSQHETKIIHQDKIIKQQVDLIYDLKAKLSGNPINNINLSSGNNNNNNISINSSNSSNSISASMGSNIGKPMEIETSMGTQPYDTTMYPPFGLSKTHPGFTPPTNKRKAYKPQKTAGGPKRSKSAFMYFCMDKRPEISAKNPSIRMVDMAKELSKMWNELTDKTIYEEMADKDRERYDREKKDWLSNKLHEGRQSLENLPIGVTGVSNSPDVSLCNTSNNGTAITSNQLSSNSSNNKSKTDVDLTSEDSNEMEGIVSESSPRQQSKSDLELVN